MSSAPIGIFDSGVGGLTVARAILDQLPNEPTLYIGDTARGPYGPRPLAEVRNFALESLDYLVNQGVKALVIACNTASAAMLPNVIQFRSSKLFNLLFVVQLQQLVLVALASLELKQLLIHRLISMPSQQRLN